MTNKLYAKPILENRFWILESDGKKVGTICKQEDRRYMFSCESGTRIFDNVDALQSSFTGDWMWGTSLSAPGPVESEKNDVKQQVKSLEANLDLRQQEISEIQQQMQKQQL